MFWNQIRQRSQHHFANPARKYSSHRPRVSVLLIQQVRDTESPSQDGQGSGFLSNFWFLTLIFSRFFPLPTLLPYSKAVPKILPQMYFRDDEELIELNEKISL
mmetsp:Transcript_25309/g.38686  ORF Transcript_25309/g.38686 Transcript_25309/m.38686 type:complete len:103 (-) Transcript_25309:68-376(-)